MDINLIYFRICKLLKVIFLKIVFSIFGIWIFSMINIKLFKINRIMDYVFVEIICIFN